MIYEPPEPDPALHPDTFWVHVTVVLIIVAGIVLAATQI